MTWSEVTEGRPQVASEDARTQRMEHRELHSLQELEHCDHSQCRSSTPPQKVVFLI